MSSKHKGTIELPFLSYTIVNFVYNSILSWLIYPMNSCLPVSNLIDICLESQIKSTNTAWRIVFEYFEKTEDNTTTRDRRIGTSSSTRHKPGWITEKARLYIQVVLISIAKGIGLGLLPCLIQKKVL